MVQVGTYWNRKVLWCEFHELLTDAIPNEDWLVFMLSDSEPDSEKFDVFVRSSIDKNILEFKAGGLKGELLHDLFDENMVDKEMKENKQYSVMTTWHNGESVADIFWQCFGATCLPETTDYDNISILCTDLDGVNRAEELKDYLTRFEEGWLPG